MMNYDDPSSQPIQRASAHSTLSSSTCFVSSSSFFSKIDSIFLPLFLLVFDVMRSSFDGPQAAISYHARLSSSTLAGCFLFLASTFFSDSREVIREPVLLWVASSSFRDQSEQYGVQQSMPFICIRQLINTPASQPAPACATLNLFLLIPPDVFSSRIIKPFAHQQFSLHLYLCRQFWLYFDFSSFSSSFSV